MPDNPQWIVEEVKREENGTWVRLAEITYQPDLDPKVEDILILKETK